MVRIRHGREGDSAGISKAHVASIQGIEGAAYSEEELALWAAGASSATYAINDPKVVFLIAEANDEIVGLAEASFEGVELNKLYVDPTYQNQGIATMLSDEIDTRVRSHGIDSLYVEASMNATPFYERIGYEQIGAHQKSIVVDAASADMKMIDMEKELR
ncbi:GNAT family N-acetyltransferase [Halococcus sediminicola]|uniref:GNAT family N-acetyltransferase n=1 Tax=Halococcus sediminicola TaxID=1264579 RepID=UPI0006793222|nr:GNAT family N-acetyltransferase [Halococcus sediminicola]